MTMLNRSGCVTLGLVAGFLWTPPAMAQRPTPTSGTGDVGTVVNDSGFFIEITGGTQQLNTLFHSFEAFSSPAGTTVRIQLDPSQSSVEYVIGRVTGNGASLIDGVLRLAGGNSPDLFLINPNGITFGENAFLLLPGSLFTSTAESISFEGNKSFSSASPGAAPLLTVSAPVGLQFGSVAQPIAFERTQLVVNPGEALAFLGGDLQVADSLLLAEGGQLSLGSVAPGSQVGFDSTTFEMDYANTTDFQDITFTQASYGVVYGDGGGSFQLQGRAVRLLEDSVLSASNFGASDGSIASIRASEKIEVVGTFENSGTAIYADAVGSGKGNRLHLDTDQLLLSQSARIVADAYGTGSSGGITINANEVLISGNPDVAGIPTALTSTAYGDGPGGDVTITASRLIAEDYSRVATATVGFGPDAGTGGDLILTVGELIMRDGASIESNTFSDGNAGNVTVNASEVLISGNLDFGGISTGLASTTYDDGLGGDVTITANRLIAEDNSRVATATVGFGPDAGTGGDLILTVGELIIRDGASIGSNTFSDGNAGNVTVTATDSVEVTGFAKEVRVEEFSTLDTLYLTIIETTYLAGLLASAESGSTGDAGSLSITTPRLNVANGAQVSVSTLGEGNGGNLAIRAEEIEVSGAVDADGGQSRIAALVGNEASGNGGSIDIETNRLQVYGGSEITTATEGAGNAGLINIRADEVDVSGRFEDSLLSSAITSSSTTNFDAGSINLNSGSVTVRDGGLIAVSNVGGGNAGNLNIASDRLYLNNGKLESLVSAGSEGNINLTAERLLLMRQGSQITTSATGSATGGNVTIVSPAIVGIENSDITANAVLGDGGNIDITTQSLIGLAFRDQLTPESDIVATSEFGVNGTVAINSFTADPGAGLIQLSDAPANGDDQVAMACAARTGNEFVASGRGGLPTDPTQMLNSSEPWIDFRTLSHFDSSDYSGEGETIKTGSVPEQSVNNLVAKDLYSNPVEAASWSLNAADQVELFAADTSKSEVDYPVNCLTETSAG